MFLLEPSACWDRGQHRRNRKWRGGAGPDGVWEQGRGMGRIASNWLRVFSGRQISLEAAAKLDFQPLSPDRVKSDFLEGWNGWKPSWASDSDAIGSRIV